MERVAFKTVELWVVAVLLVVGFVAMIFYGWVVSHVARGGQKAGWVGYLAYELASSPTTIGRLFGGPAVDLRAPDQRFAGQSGFAFGYKPGERPDAGYLLLSRYDGDKIRSVVELVDLNAQKVIHSWAPDIDAINQLSQLNSNISNVKRDFNLPRYRMIHPLATEDGGIVFHHNSPMVKVDACGRVEWTIDRLFHHSREIGPDGNYWVPAIVEPQTVPNVSDVFWDHTLNKVSPTGQILYEKSFVVALLENGFKYMIFGLYGGYTANPVHLNDIQPVLQDGPFWQRGDLFLSLRNQSMIVLYRPSTNKVIWSKQGPWLNQHDVDILNDHEIAVFDNNTIFAGDGFRVDGTSGIVIYDFATDTARSPYKAVFDKHDIKTASEGLFEILSNGDFIVEEQNAGRLMRLTSSGEIVWQYVDGARDGQVYILSWSRFLSSAEAEALPPAQMRSGRLCP